MFPVSLKNFRGEIAPWGKRLGQKWYIFIGTWCLLTSLLVQGNIVTLFILLGKIATEMILPVQNWYLTLNLMVDHVKLLYVLTLSEGTGFCHFAGYIWGNWVSTFGFILWRCWCRKWILFLWNEVRDSSIFSYSTEQVLCLVLCLVE